MKKLILLFTLFLSLYSSAQDAVDIGTPADSPFQLGGDIQGTIQNSVNEVTGKVTFSAPLASIAASSVSHNVGLTYNGQTAFKNGQQNNKYNPTGTVGVGWSLSTPKIVTDNKNTGTRDDDVFYLLDGATNTRLICVDRGNTVNGSVWEFQMEKYAPWKIKFYYSNGAIDYWKICKENGTTYYFGKPNANKARENILRHGNWIGSSNNFFGSTMQSMVWNLYKMEDQWGNNLIFEYDTVLQGTPPFLQTEAAYLKKIISSNGANIQLTYGTKTSEEYYEQHKEASEPDAYQERYEKKYLQSVSGYNNKNQLVSTHNLGYTLNGGSLNKKRYLTSLTQTAYNNGQNETLPAQAFEYYYTGTFKGGLKKITYPTGGSVTYNYNNKLLFNNNVNLYETSFTPPSGYEHFSSYVSDNYGLHVYKTQNTVSGGKYRFKMYRFWWNGQKWDWNEFTFPHLIAHQNIVGQVLQGFQAVLEKDFYGFIYDKGTTADVYLFHLEKDGHTWDYYTNTSRSIGSEDPSFVSGNGFAALQNHRGGQLYTYVWNGTYWNYKQINQGAGQYYIAATNNYIISLDEDGGTDMVTNVSHEDNYYMHYLDAEKKWQTKSWSAAADPSIAGIEKASYWYPDNSIIGFMADDNPELFLRWDTNYNLTNVDNVLGSYVDSNPMQSISNNMFTIYNNFYKYPFKSARFNGVNWSVSSLPSSSAYYAKINFGENILMFQGHSMYNNGHDVGYHMYDPNSHSWVYNSLNAFTWYGARASAINQDFVIAGDIIYNRSNQGAPSLTFNQIGGLQYDNGFSHSDGLSHTYVMQKETIASAVYFRKASYLYINKNNGLLETIDLGLKAPLRGNSKIGGYTPFMSPSAIWLGDDVLSSSTNWYFYRIIDDKLNNAVYDIVVNHIDINDDNGALRKIQYTYHKPKCTPDNSSTFYSEVVIENKGVGTGNIGKIVKKFNDGSTDLAMVGLPLEVITRDASNNLVKKTTMTWRKYTKTAHNGSNTVDQSYYIRAIKEKEELFFNGSPDVVSETTNTYNTYGLKTASTSTDSKGKSVRQDVSYAYQQYSFVKDKNMLSFPYQTTTRINNAFVNVERSKWINDNGKAYINENWSGSSTGTLRLNNKISKVESTGNVLESNNGKGIYNAVLFGNDNLYEVATISNAKYQDIVNQLDVTYAQLQNLTNSSLKTELLKLYDRLPAAGISLSFYDNNGRIINRINGRKEESFVYYDTLGREDYITDAQGNILEKKKYHLAN